MQALPRKESAGLLLFRHRECELEVLLAHPGGPFWKAKDEGAWTVPKGEIGAGEGMLAAARREFEEETGYRPDGLTLSLGFIRQAGGKIVHVWAIEDDWDPQNLISNTIELEWPPRSGCRMTIPEIDKAVWFDLTTARSKILKSQLKLLDRLLGLLGRPV